MGANLHIEALAYLRYVRQLPLVATEVGAWNADVLGVSMQSCTEVEIKKTLSDLKADFRNKRAKHYVYETGTGSSQWKRSKVPNYMYFMVPEALKDKALEVLESQNPKYGLLWVPAHVYGDRETTSLGYSAGKNVQVARRALRLHGDPPSNDLVWTVIKRLSSELVGLYQSHEELERKLTSDLADIRANVRASAALMAAFTPDPPDPVFLQEDDDEALEPTENPGQ